MGMDILDMIQRYSRLFVLSGTLRRLIALDAHKTDDICSKVAGKNPLATLARKLLQLMYMRGLLPASDRTSAFKFETGAQVADRTVYNRESTHRTAAVISSHHIFPLIIKQYKAWIRPCLLFVAGLYDIALSGAVAGIYFKRIYS